MFKSVSVFATARVARILFVHPSHPLCLALQTFLASNIVGQVCPTWHVDPPHKQLLPHHTLPIFAASAFALKLENSVIRWVDRILHHRRSIGLHALALPF